MNCSCAYVIDKQNYRETSAIVQLLTREHGMIRAIVHGIRKPKSKLKALLMPFIPLSMTISGSGDLVRLSNIEPNAEHGIMLQGQAIYCGLYMNELLYHLVKGTQADHDLITTYQQTLLALSGGHHALTLRQFEWALFHHLGLMPSLKQDLSGQAINKNQVYRVHPLHGICLANLTRDDEDFLFTGNDLIAIACQMLDDQHIQKQAKRLMRLWVNHHLRGRPILARSLFVQP